MKQILASFIALSLILSLCACSKKAEEPTWQEQYDLGARYLSEGNYEEAILAFTAAIEIDPMQAETYEKLADTYLALGDLGSALQTLRDGLDATGDEQLQIRIDELTAPEPTPMPAPEPTPEPTLETTSEPTPEPISTLESEPTQTPASAFDSSPQLDPLWSDLKFGEVMFLGHSIQNLDIWEMKTALEEEGFTISELENDDHWFISSSGIDAMQYKDEDYVCLWNYRSYSGQKAIGVRGIHMNDNMETVLTQLGVSNASEAVDYIEEIAAKSYKEYNNMVESLRKLDNGSFYVGGSGATPLTDGTYRLNSIDIGMYIHTPDIQDNKYYEMRLSFDRESDGQFVGLLTNYCMNVYTP